MQNKPNPMKPDAKARPQTAEEKAHDAKAKTDTGSKSGSDKSSCGC